MDQQAQTIENFGKLADIEVPAEFEKNAALMTKLGEIDIVPVIEKKEEVKPVEKPKVEEPPKPETFKIGDQEYSADDLQQAIEIAKNPQAFIRKATYQTQQVSKEKTALEQEREQMQKERLELDKQLKEVKGSALGDPAIEKLVAVLEVQQRKQVDLENRLNDRIQYDADRIESDKDNAAVAFVNKAYNEAVEFYKDFPDVKIPRPGTQEFMKWVTMGQQVNPLKVMAFEQFQDRILKSGKPAPRLDGVDSTPPASSENGNLTETQKEVMDFFKIPGKVQGIVSSQYGR